MERSAKSLVALEVARMLVPPLLLRWKGLTDGLRIYLQTRWKDVGKDMVSVRFAALDCARRFTDCSWIDGGSMVSLVGGLEGVAGSFGF